MNSFRDMPENVTTSAVEFPASLPVAIPHGRPVVPGRPLGRWDYAAWKTRCCSMNDCMATMAQWAANAVAGGSLDLDEFAGEVEVPVVDPCARRHGPLVRSCGDVPDHTTPTGDVWMGARWVSTRYQHLHLTRHPLRATPNPDIAQPLHLRLGQPPRHDRPRRPRTHLHRRRLRKSSATKSNSTAGSPKAASNNAIRATWPKPSKRPNSSPRPPSQPSPSSPSSATPGPDRLHRTFR